MKVGTDGVLLGAWWNIEHANRLLDIGTGTGLLAMMAAQRNVQVQIDALEIDLSAAQQAKENIAASPFASRIHVHAVSAQQFCENCQQKYDVIVCNPPYFTASLKCPNRERTLARHSDTLSIDDLLAVCTDLLATKGTLNLILPTTEAGN